MTKPAAVSTGLVRLRSPCPPCSNLHCFVCGMFYLQAASMHFARNAMCDLTPVNYYTYKIQSVYAERKRKIKQEVNDEYSLPNN